jgi:serine/threonine protein kinase
VSGRRPGPPPPIEGYTPLRALPAGGFADVFVYRQALTDRDVAIKVLAEQINDDERLRRFRAEAGIMARLSSHPSIVTVYAAGMTADGRPYLVMEYCSGEDLNRRSRREPLSVADALSIAVRIAGAIETAHGSGVLHRDIKPANILTTDYGHPALTDFGIASVGQEGGSTEGLSLPWAPPEVIDDPDTTTRRSDVYSLGATLWHLLVGRSPFWLPDGPNEVRAMVDRIVHMAAPRTGRPDVPPALERVLAAAMAKDPADRPATALEFAQALRAVEMAAGYGETSIEVLVAHPPQLPRAAPADAPAYDEPVMHTGAVAIDSEPTLSRALDTESIGDTFVRLDDRLGPKRTERRTSERRSPLLPSRDDPGPAPLTDEDVQFSVVRPAAVGAEQWASLLVLAHKSDRFIHPQRGPVDPLEEVRLRTQRHFGASPTKETRGDSLHGLPRGTTVRVAPDLTGVVCNPPVAEFMWAEEVHEAPFRIRAPASFAGMTVRGTVRIWCGPLILGELPVSIPVLPAGERPSAHAAPVAEEAVNRYRKIFPSYSHHDREMVRYFVTAAQALGDQYLQDVLALRSGERWDDRLVELISEADVFQLFWSTNSMRSEYCRREWEEALSFDRPWFIRPIYWESPLPEDRVRGLPPDALRVIHFAQVPPAPSGAQPAPSAPATAAPRPAEVRGVPVAAGAASAPATAAPGLVETSDETADSTAPWSRQRSARYREERTAAAPSFRAESLEDSLRHPREVRAGGPPDVDIPDFLRDWDAGERPQEGLSAQPVSGLPPASMPSAAARRRSSPTHPGVRARPVAARQHRGYPLVALVTLVAVLLILAFLLGRTL